MYNYTITLFFGDEGYIALVFAKNMINGINLVTELCNKENPNKSVIIVKALNTSTKDDITKERVYYFDIY